MEQDARAIAGQPIDPSTPLYKVPSFRLLFITRVASTTAFQMVGVIVGWHVYELTNSALHLGLIGLAQFLPQFFLMLPAGQVADRLNRRTVLWWCYGVAFLSAAGLMWVASQDRPTLALIYALVALNMAARTFEQPVMQALLPVMAPRAVLNRAIAAHISARQAAVLIGPLLGGVLYYFGPVFDYGVCAAPDACGRRLRLPAAQSRQARKADGAELGVGRGRLPLHLADARRSSAPCCSSSWRRCSAACRRCCRSMRATSSASAPGAPACCAARPRSAACWPRRCSPARRSRARAGSGCSPRSRCSRSATIAFGFSTSLVLSIVALMAVGVGDLVSTVIRQTLIQMQTPDEMRGRVFSVNSLFYGTSSQIGQFRAGITAEWFGAVAAVAIGGAALLGAVAVWAWLFPALRRVDNPALVGQVDPMGDQEEGWAAAASGYFCRHQQAIVECRRHRQAVASSPG